MWALPEKMVLCGSRQTDQVSCSTSFTDSFKELLPNWEGVMSLLHMCAHTVHWEGESGGFELCLPLILMTWTWYYPEP